MSTPAHEIVDRTLTEATDLVDAEFALLERRRQSLLDLRSAMLDLRTSLPGPGQSAELIPAAHGTAEVERLLERCDGHVCGVVLTVEAGPGIEDSVYRETERRMAQGLRQRTLYAADVASTVGGRRWMTRYARIGEEQRVSVRPPSEFAVFGTYAVIATAQWHDPSSGYVLIRNPMLISTFQALFEASYAAGIPVQGAPDPGSDTQLSDLLGLGLKDEAIARYLGVGLRTVRRRVAHLMEIHQVDTRYQLGVALGRQAAHATR